MKTLYIIRHAKSSWDFPELKDFDRPLSDKWKKDAKKLWEYFNENRIFPDLIVSSDAKRAKSTAKRICKKIWYKKEDILFERWIYDNHTKGIEYYIDYIKKLDNKNDRIFLVWHNMAFEELIHYFLWSSFGHLKSGWFAKINLDVKSWGWS